MQKLRKYLIISLIIVSLSFILFNSKKEYLSEENILGVYVINEETKMPEFVSLGKNFYKDEKYVYVDYNRSKDEKNLNLYDRILLYPNFVNKNIKVSRWRLSNEYRSKYK